MGGLDKRVGEAEIGWGMENETLEDKLADALKLRLAIIGDREMRERDPDGQLAQLREVSERIVALQTELPAGTHPQLLHYFQRASYEKALAWIEQEGVAGTGK